MLNKGITQLLSEQNSKSKEELQKDVARLTRRLEREKLARMQAEDLLEQKAADLFEKNRDLLSLSDGLEKLVAQRTAQMQNARDEALTALQVKSDFIANMSHELRTPMNGVLGILALLSDEALSEKQRELLEIAQASGEHLLLVINDVLDFSKIEADKIELVMAPLNIRSYINNLCKPFQLQASQKNIQFQYHVADEVPNHLISDKLRLTQIITNLLSNAIKFTNEGTVALDFKLLNKESEFKNTYRITVSDTGIGISPQNVDAVFSAFEQADTSITREFGGTGLGMSITKRLVDMFNGQISLQSELGSGTSFFVDITCEIAQTSTEQKYTTIGCLESTHKAKILLVEDNKINQIVATKMLDSWGVDVSLAEDGQAAIDILQEESFDLILMDLQMPIKGGIEASKEIREKGLIGSQTPIIAMTAHSSKEHIDECFEAGMQAHISKPIDRDLLKAIIQDYAKTETIDNESETLADVPSLSHIDIQDGLQRLNGDWKLLYTLINNFVDEHSTVGEALAKFKQSNDKQAALNLLHRIKGSGANLGMSALSELASKGEQQLRNKVALTDKQINELQTGIEKISNEFGRLESPNQTPTEADNREESTEYLLNSMDNIVDNLSKDVLASEDSLKDLLQCTLPDVTLALVQEASEAMQKFDINGVAQAITKARETLE